MTETMIFFMRNPVKTNKYPFFFQVTVFLATLRHGKIQVGTGDMQAIACLLSCMQTLALLRLVTKGCM